MVEDVAARSSPGDPQRRRVYLLIYSVDDRGGVQQSVATLANALADHHEVEVISVHRQRPRPVSDFDPRVRISYLVDRRKVGITARRGLRGRLLRRLDRLRPRLIHPPGDDHRFSLLAELQIIRKLRRLQPGILVTNRPVLHVAGARYAPRHVPVIAFEHGTLLSRGTKKREAMRRYGSGLAALVVLNDHDREANAELLEGVVSRVRAIPNGIPRLPEVGEEHKQEPVIVSAGTLLQRKGFDRLIRAFVPVATKHPDWQLHIYGRGRQRPRLARQIRRLGLEDRVSLKGFTDDLDTAFAESSLVAVGARFEAFGMTIVEAMSQGVPVVSFDCPNGPRNIIKHGQDGVLVPDGNIKAFSRALLQMVEDDDRRAQMGLAARENVRRFEIGTVLDEWDRLFDEVSPRGP